VKLFTAFSMNKHLRKVTFDMDILLEAGWSRCRFSLMELKICYVVGLVHAGTWPYLFQMFFSPTRFVFLTRDAL